MGVFRHEMWRLRILLKGKVNKNKNEQRRHSSKFTLFVFEPFDCNLCALWKISICEWSHENITQDVVSVAIPSACQLLSKSIWADMYLSSSLRNIEHWPFFIFRENCAPWRTNYDDSILSSFIMWPKIFPLYLFRTLFLSTGDNIYMVAILGITVTWCFLLV